MTLFEASDRIGGQLNLARAVPGKSEFDETLRYYRHEIERLGVELRLGSRASAADLRDGGFDHVVIATGVRPRVPAIEGIDHPSVVGYADVLGSAVELGERVAVIGAGGIGFDVAEYLTHDPRVGEGDLDDYLRTWGIDRFLTHPGGLLPEGGKPHAGARQVVLMQRSEGKLGAGLGKTTGWIHRATLAMRGVEMVGGVTYERIDDRGVHVRVGGEARVLEVDHVAICAGQESVAELVDALEGARAKVHVIGGAKKAGEIDAKRAIDEGTRAALSM